MPPVVCVYESTIPSHHLLTPIVRRRERDGALRTRRVEMTMYRCSIKRTFAFWRGGGGTAGRSPHTHLTWQWPIMHKAGMGYGPTSVRDRSSHNSSRDKTTTYQINEGSKAVGCVREYVVIEDCTVFKLSNVLSIYLSCICLGSISQRSRSRERSNLASAHRWRRIVRLHRYASVMASVIHPVLFGPRIHSGWRLANAQCKAPRCPSALHVRK